MKMASSKLKVEHRPSLFLHKYEYRAAIRIVGAGWCHHIDTIEQYKDKIERIKEFWQPHGTIMLSPYRADYANYLDNVDLKIIDLYLNWKKEHKELFSFRQEHDRVSIFGNDFKKLETIKDIYPKAKMTHARVLEADTLYFKKDPKFNHRVYIKSKYNTSADFCNTMAQFVEKNKDNPNYKISAALVRLFCNRKRETASGMSMQGRILHGSYYIDYNESSTEMYLHILFPDMLGKPHNCKKHPNN